jgi:hypothetical protein
MRNAKEAFGKLLEQIAQYEREAYDGSTSRKISRKERPLRFSQSLVDLNIDAEAFAKGVLQKTN